MIKWLKMAIIKWGMLLFISPPTPPHPFFISLSFFVYHCDCATYIIFYIINETMETLEIFILIEFQNNDCLISYYQFFFFICTWIFHYIVVHNHRWEQIYKSRSKKYPLTLQSFIFYINVRKYIQNFFKYHNETIISFIKL